MAVAGLYILRQTYRLHGYIQEKHFEKLAQLLMVTTLVLAYLYFAEQLTVWYGNVPDHMAVQNSLLTGMYAVPFW